VESPTQEMSGGVEKYRKGGGGRKGDLLTPLSIGSGRTGGKWGVKRGEKPRPNQTGIVWSIPNLENENRKKFPKKGGRKRESKRKNTNSIRP